jgi:hypothetical protein
LGLLPKTLFAGQRSLAEFLADKRDLLTAAVRGYGDDRLLNTPTGDVVDYMIDQFSCEPVKLAEEEIAVSIGEGPILARHPSAWDLPPFVTHGRHRVVFHLPFSGDAELLDYRTSTVTGVYPRAAVVGSELRFEFVTSDPSGSDARREFEEQLGRLRDYVGWSAQEVSEYLRRLPDVAQQVVARRRSLLLERRGLEEAIGFPLRERSVSPGYAPPLRRHPSPKPSPVSTQQFVPEPALAEAHYDHILRVLQSTAEAIERAPRTFRDMDEPDLRNYLLIVLNSHYEGDATGETFRGAGKTDIIVQVDGKAVFIAECKFWRGPESLREAVDQLLGYLTWRDTKAAILLFNRGRDFSGILEQIPGVVAGHLAFKRRLPTVVQTASRYVLGRPDDHAREVLLAVLGFHIPLA